MAVDGQWGPACVCAIQPQDVVAFLPIGLSLITAVIFLISVVAVLRRARKALRARAQAGGLEMVDESAALLEAWKRKYVGPTGTIASEQSIGMVLFFGVFALFWNSVVATVLYAALKDPKRPLERLPVFLGFSLFVVVGVGLIGIALLFLVRWLRYGRSQLELETMPGVIGGRLAGRVWARFRPSPAAKITMVLECVRQATQRTNRGREVTESIVWATTHELQGQDAIVGPSQGVYLPFEFFIPRECASTTALGQEDGIFWRLRVRGEVEGPDFVATFRVPVFVTAESGSQESLVLEERARADTLTQGPPPSLQSRIRPTATGGTEIVWPPLQNPVAGLVLLAITAGLAVGAYFFAQKAPFFVPLFVGVFVILSGFAALTVLFGASRVELRPDGRIKISRTLAGMGSPKEFDAQEVVCVRRAVSAQSGNKLFYNLELELADGRKIPLSWGGDGEKEATYLEAMIESWLEQTKRQRSS